MWESRWPSWAFRPNEPYGFRGRKAILNHAHALVSACPWYVNWHPRTLSNTAAADCTLRLFRAARDNVPSSSQSGNQINKSMNASPKTWATNAIGQKPERQTRLAKSMLTHWQDTYTFLHLNCRKLGISCFLFSIDEITWLDRTFCDQSRASRFLINDVIMLYVDCSRR